MFRKERERVCMHLKIDSMGGQFHRKFLLIILLSVYMQINGKNLAIITNPYFIDP